MVSPVVVIPARYASTRLPAKPLAMIGSKTLIERVHHQASRSGASRVIVATDDVRIAEVVQHFGGEVVMTRADHESGTDRIQEVTARLALPGDAVVVNVQGDEPLIPPEVIDQVARNLVESGAMMATLCEPLQTFADISNPNIVKVTRNVHGMALYFSRAPIPWDRDEFPRLSSSDTCTGWFRHLGIYAYRASLLDRFVKWPMAPLERIEKLEQLRVLWNGENIHVGEACMRIPAGVDTPDDLERVRRWVEAHGE